MARLAVRCGTWVFATSLLLACVSPLHASGPGLLLGTDEWPPYEYMTEDGMSGIAVEVVCEAFRRMERPVASLGYYPWKRALVMLEHGCLDVAFSGVKANPRQLFAYFHETPLFEIDWVLFTWRGSGLRNAVRSLRDLDPYKICATRGFFYTPEIDAYLNARDDIVRKSTGAKGLYLLANGRVDFVLCDKLLGSKLVELLCLGDSVVQVDGPPLGHTHAYVMFSRKTVRPGLVEEFDKALRQIKNEGLFKRIVDTHLHYYLR